MSDLGLRLERFVAARLPDAVAVRVASVSARTDGFSAETFAFEAKGVRDGARETSGDGPFDEAERAVLGPHAPSGFAGLLDGAPAPSR